MTDNVIAEAHIDIADPVRTVRVQRRMDTEPYRVYRAWSSPEAMSEWFPDQRGGIARARNALRACLPRSAASGGTCSKPSPTGGSSSAGPGWLTRAG